MESEDLMHRRLMASLAVGAVLALLAGSALAADAKKPDGTVKLSEGSMALGIGWSWGHGTLTFQGKAHKFKVDGLSVGEVGVTKASASGNVYNLKTLADFDGVYAAASAGATAGKGVGVTVVTNDKGVQLSIKSVTKGASLKLAAEGLKIKLEN
jgi:hypothetical protein